MSTEPCTWPVLYTCAEPDWTPEQKVTAEAMAIDLLWNWSGRTLGLCPVVVRPCRQDCTRGWETFWGRGPYTPGYAMDHSAPGPYGVAGGEPAIVGGEWHNFTCGMCGDSCGCDFASTLRLPGPIAEVEEVTIDGIVLDAAHYRVDNHVLLVRTDGGSWPTCQSMGRPLGTEGTFGISYLKGAPVPVGGQVAAGTLAIELGKAICHDKSCALPQRVQTISRQGVTVTLLDSFEDAEKGRTGIWLIDSWLLSVMNRPVPSRVHSVDLPKPRNRVTTWP